VYSFAVYGPGFALFYACWSRSGTIPKKGGYIPSGKQPPSVGMVYASDNLQSMGFKAICLKISVLALIEWQISKLLICRRIKFSF
jgi:hypothetical protein